MSTKSAQNGHQVKAAPAKKTTPRASRIPPVAPKSLAGRIAELEEQMALMTTTLEQMGQVLAGFVEQQAMAAAMPQIEQQVRANIKQQIQAEGWMAALPQQPAATPGG